MNITRKGNYHKLYRTTNLNQIQGKTNKKNVRFVLNQIKHNEHSIVYILKGPAGVGKTASCYNIAQTVNCQDLSDDGIPCGKCQSCLDILAKPMRNNDIYIINGALKNKVDDIKEIIETVKLSNPFYNKICIILDEWHNLSTAALEALLGIFEDAQVGPSEEECHYMFLLPTTSLDRIPPALLSRAQILEFEPLTKSELSDYLITICDDQQLEYEEEAFDLIYNKTRGGVRDSLKILERIAFSNDFFISKEAAEDILKAGKSEIAPKIFKAILNLNTPKALNLARKYDSDNGLQENDFNDLIDLFDNYFDDEDCKFDDKYLIQVLNTLNQKRDEFLKDSSLRSSQIFLVAIRSIILDLKNGLLQSLERKLASKNMEFAERLFNLYPQIKIVDGELMLILQEPTERASWIKNGLESSFVNRTFDSLSIDGYIFQ